MTEQPGHEITGTARGGPDRIPDLRDLIDEKVVEIIAGARDGGWGRDEVLLAIDDCLALRWPKDGDIGTK